MTLWIKSDLSINRLHESTRTSRCHLNLNDSQTHTFDSDKKIYIHTHIYKMGYLVMCEFLWLWNEYSVANSTLRLRKQVAIFLDESVHWNRKVTCWIKRFIQLDSLNVVIFNGRNLFVSRVNFSFFYGLLWYLSDETDQKKEFTRIKNNPNESTCPLLNQSDLVVSLQN